MLDLLKQKFNLDFNQVPVQIPNAGRVDLARWFRELDYKVGAEIGVEKGEFSKIICEFSPQLKLYGIDSYRPYSGYSDFVKPATFEAIRTEAINRLTPYVTRNRYQFVEKFSEEALQDFEDNSLDFVYIDGNHQDPFVTQDIVEWTKKVRPGGVVAGHDYSRVKRVNWAVKDAIQKYTKDNNISPWFVIGSDAMNVGEVRDGSRSWLFVR